MKYLGICILLFGLGLAFSIGMDHLIQMNIRESLQTMLSVFAIMFLSEYVIITLLLLSLVLNIIFEFRRR